MIPILKNLKTIYLTIFILSLFIIIFFIPIFKSDAKYNNQKGEILDINPNGFVWPIPGYTQISSYFGNRNSPTLGASSSHAGIDIPAPQGSKFIAIHDGEITFRNFLGGGGYTITLSFDNYKITYCHCDPNFIVEVGETVKQGQVIGFVGPKNVYGVKGNPYKDSNGNPTNRCNNWFTSSFRYKIK